MKFDSPSELDGRLLNATGDVPDFRDWPYQPALVQLKRSVPPPRKLDILDQGSEGACTGFALAALVNVLRRKSGRRGQVSERMLYEMARRHDEWQGFRYEGSSCRGAIKGFYNMGVCARSSWPYVDGEAGHLTIEAAKNARRNTLGAYYRLGIRVSDFHAAINEAGAIYCSASVHEGWDKVDPETGKIPFVGQEMGGHAFAIVGYNSDGFWIQNSWGKQWGRKGLALWTYEDWQKNISDAWVLRLALSTPQIWHLPLEGGSDAGRSHRRFSKTPARAEIAGHFVHIDDGEFHDSGQYWSNQADLEETTDLLAASNKYDHLVLYAHGGLNNVKASARRVAAMKETFKDNRVYPLHFMYDTGLIEETKDVILGKSHDASERAGGFSDWTDKIIEHATHKAGRGLWRQMKFGAQAPFESGGAGLAVLEAVRRVLDGPGSIKRLHLVGHSTGGILHAFLASALSALAPDLRLASVSLLAPAATTDLFNQHFRPLLTSPTRAPGINKLDIYNLTERMELDDSVAKVYRKSLLYLVSRSFEENPRPAPVLGMEMYSKKLAKSLSRLECHYSDGSSDRNRKTMAKTHGGFDNDPRTMNSVLRRILGKKPALPFTSDSLKY